MFIIAEYPLRNRAFIGVHQLIFRNLRLRLKNLRLA